KGDGLHILGGLDDEGDPLKAHWVYNLAEGRKRAFDGSAWKRSTSLDDSTAWAASANLDDNGVIMGGVAGFYAGKGKKDDPNERLPAKIRKALQLKEGSWRDRAVPPHDTTAAHAVAVDGALFVGPGNDLKGGVAVWDGGWIALPDLPEEVGLGQMHVANDTLL